MTAATRHRIRGGKLVLGATSMSSRPRPLSEHVLDDGWLEGYPVMCLVCGTMWRRGPRGGRCRARPGVWVAGSRLLGLASERVERTERMLEEIESLRRLLSQGVRRVRLR